MQSTYGNVLISIITVSYNSSRFIRETIESVLTQEYTYFEYIICDDCSTDNTWEIVQEYQDTRIRAIRNQSNVREYANRNKCVGLAKGEYLIFIDGDDIMYPHALVTFLKYALMFPECAMVIARDWDSRLLCPLKVMPVDLYRFEYFDFSILGNFTKILFKTPVLKNEPFPLHIKTGDSYIQLKIGQQHAVVIIPDGLTWWRRRSGNATSQLFNNFRHNAESLNYKLDLLTGNCPLSFLEIEKAKQNIYGFYLRLIIRLFLKFDFKDAFYLIKRVNVPLRYYKSIFKARQVGYFKHVSGDEPLHTLRSSEQQNKLQAMSNKFDP